CLPPVDALVVRERGPIARGAPLQYPLAAAEAQESSRAEAFRDLVHHAVFQVAPEIDENVAAEDDLHLAEGVIGNEVVVAEEDVFWKRSSHREVIVGLGVVRRKRRRASGAVVAFREGLEQVGAVHALLRRSMAWALRSVA